MAKTKTKTKSTTSKDYYQTLGVAPRSHFRVIEETYWERAHDLHDVPTRKAQQRLGALNEAYEVLASPHKRAEYDRHWASRRESERQQSSSSFLGAIVSILGKPFRPD